MEYCGPKGLPHSIFLDWDKEDQDKAIAWMLETRSRCPSCGTHAEEWLDEDGKRLDPPPYTVKVTRCLGCVAVEAERSRMPEGQTGYLTSFSPYVGESE